MPSVVSAPPTPSSQREVLTRVVSAFALLPIIIFAIVWGGVPFAALIALVAGRSAYEVCAMALHPFPKVAWVAVAAAAALPVFSALNPGHFESLPLAFVFACALGMGAGFVSALFAEDPPAAATRPLWMTFALVYCGLPVGLIALLRQVPDGAWWVVLLCTVTWMNDTGAFFVGRALGRHKMLPKASPKKSWEGFAGGLAFAVFFAFFVRFIGFHALTPLDCIAIAVPASVLGPVGDLSESLLKRSLGVKDSGRVMPGHGGLLDRVDALLFNSFLLFAYATLVGHW